MLRLALFFCLGVAYYYAWDAWWPREEAIRGQYTVYWWAALLAFQMVLTHTIFVPVADWLSQ